MTSLNLSRNFLRAEGAKHVAEAIKVNVSALRFDWYHFELDLTGGSTAGCANTTKVAMVQFDISKNYIRAEGGKALAEALTDNQVMQELSIAGNELSNYGRDMSGVIVISGAISTMGALTSLNIDDNRIPTALANAIF